MRTIISALAAFTLASTAHASPVEQVVRFGDFFALAQPFSGPVPAGRTTHYDLGFAEVDLHATIQGGLAAASAEAEIHARHASRLSFDEARHAGVLLEARSLSGALGLSSEVTLSATVDFHPVLTLGDPLPYAVDPVRLGTFDTGNSGTAGSALALATDYFWLDDFAVPVGGLQARTEISGLLQQTGFLTFKGLRGDVVATHESGAMRRADFSMAQGESVFGALDLSLPGAWTLALEDVTVTTDPLRAELRLMLTESALGYGVPVQGLPQPGSCGDFGSDADNTFPPVLGLALPSCRLDEESPFPGGGARLDFALMPLSLGVRRADLGALTVAPPTPVPLPPTLPLFGAAALGLGLLARERGGGSNV